MEILHNSIKCSLCNNILLKPVILPCGHSICQHHEEEIKSKETSESICSFCSSVYKIPATGLTRNIGLDELIHREIQSIDLGDKYECTKNRLEESNHVFDCIVRLRNTSQWKINTTIGDVRTKIDIKREQLKMRIDEEALRLVEKLNKYENACYGNLVSLNDEYDRKIEKWEDEFKKLKLSLSTFNPANWKYVFDTSTSNIENIGIEYKSFEKRLFLRRLNDFKKLNFQRIDNDADIIKNNVISLKVEGLRDYNTFSDLISFNSFPVYAFGIEFRLLVQIKKFKDDRYVGMYLYANQTPRTVNFKIDCDLRILCPSDSNKSFAMSMRKKYYINLAWGHEKMMKLSDLFNNMELYNSQNESFIAQSVIKCIQWI